MLKRTLFFCNSYHLSIKLDQLQVNNRESGEIKSIPVEDIGFVVLEHPQITFTQSVIQLFAKYNIATVFCDEKYMPVSMLLNLDSHHIQNEKFRNQISASEPLKKQLWQKIIQAKILNQASLIKRCGKEDTALKYMASQVKSGDAGNEEARAARKYWSVLFDDEFKRERYGNSPNPALNYGYAILRAAVARALAGSGLLPTLGIHHRNKYNAFCLADDIMEPYRPFVDGMVKEMMEKNMDCDELGKNEKIHILGLLNSDVEIKGRKSPFLLAVSQTTASLSRSFDSGKAQIIFPVL